MSLPPATNALLDLLTEEKEAERVRPARPPRRRCSRSTVHFASDSGPDVAELRLAVEHRLREGAERHELHVRPARPDDRRLHQLARDSLTAERLRYVRMIEDHELPVRSRRERQLGQASPLALDEEGASMLFLLHLNGNLFCRHDQAP